MDNLDKEVVEFYKSIGFILVEIKSSVFRIEESTLIFQTDHKNHTLDASTILYKDAERIYANTVTAVLDEIEREVEAGDLTRKFMESLEHPTPEEYYAYNKGIADIKAIIKSKRTEI